MRNPQLRLSLGNELIADNFAGGGGASLGIEQALGRPVDIAVNHDAVALAMHKANHPKTRHYCEDVFDIDPRKVTHGRQVGLAWFSPDCTFHSKARGGKPFRDRDRARRTRGLAGVAIRWAKEGRPRAIALENVEEWADWGPLLSDGTPCRLRRGLNFRRWVRTLENLGYAVDMRELRACDYGAPTTRKRLFVIARCDKQEIIFPDSIHGDGLLPYHTAAECIDWSIPCPSIFDRKRPLAEATLRRIARGIMRYVVENPRPFIVPMQHTNRPVGVDEPLQTITTQGNKFNLVVPTLVQTGYGEDRKRNGGRGQPPRALDIEKPLGTVVAGGVKHALVAAFLARHYGGHENDGSSMSAPMHTITTKDHHALVTSHIVKLKGTCADGQPVTTPLHTIQAGGQHYGEVRAFLLKYYGTEQNPRLDSPLGTITTKDRFGLVTVHGSEYVIVDIGMRMLTPRELFNAQGFDDNYIIDVEVDGKPMTKTAQVRLVGNSVSPPVARALVEANFRHESNYAEDVA